MQVLAVNVGSSSLKIDLWEEDLSVARIKLEARGIAHEQGALFVNDHEQARKTFADQGSALAELLKYLPDPDKISGIGHRVVHGGSRYRSTVWLGDGVLSDLEALVPLSPLHQPPALAVIRACRERFRGLPQAAVFDTAFHGALPPRAYTYAVPGAWREAGVRRYGFHGIACADIVAQLGRTLREKAVILHLGAGCSATAVLNGKSVDTTMGFTPLEGLVMATRCGDIDPGALLYAQREFNLTAQATDHLLNQESGLLALSGISSDMRELLKCQDEQAMLAIEVFCYRAAKATGALAVSLGGLDQIIFSGGIGERAAAVRSRIGAMLNHLRIFVDQDANLADEQIISIADSPVEVRIVVVDEGRHIARETIKLATKSD